MRVLTQRLSLGTTPGETSKANMGETTEAATVATSGAASEAASVGTTGVVTRDDKRITINSNHQLQKCMYYHLNTPVDSLNVDR